MIEQRKQWLFAALALVIAVVLAYILLALAEDASGQAPDVPPSKYDAKMFELDRQALDRAYQTQLEHLFAVWMKDETGQPARMATGVRQARRAYIEASARIDAREQEYKR